MSFTKPDFMALKTYFTSTQIKPITQTSRNSTLDLVKVFSAFGVVFIHVHAESWIAEIFARIFLTLCVPFFFTTSLFYFTISLRKDVSIRKIIYRIWQRIVVPFLTWSIIYTVLLLVKNIITGGGRGLYSIDIVRVFLYGESSEQMYYLPELIVMQIIALSIFLLINKTKRTIHLYLFICSIGYLVWGQSHKYFGITPAFHVLAYTAVAFYLASGVNSSTKNWPELITGVILIILSFLKVWGVVLPDVSNILFHLPIGGLGLFLISLNIPDIRIPSWLTILCSTSFGIYLSHVMFLEALEFFLERVHFVIHYHLFTKIVVSFLIFTISILFTLFIRRIPKLKPFLLGENE